MYKNRQHKTLLLFIFFLLATPKLFSQKKKDKVKFKDIVQVSGYVKYLNITRIADAKNIFNDNLIHNRVNIKAYLGNHFEVALEGRNRLFYGESLKINPFFAQQIGADNGLIDMSWNIIETKAVVLNTKIDRLYVNFYKGKFDIRLGRQRINWGIANLMNPNDLFNAYNFLDFDYEERPGTDALRFVFNTGAMSALDFAYRPAKNLDESIIALKFKFNRWKYDFQWLVANYKKDIALGVGWAGNIKNAGFKGEATFFQNRANFSKAKGVLSATIGLDYCFKDGVYTNIGFLFNSQGISKKGNLSLAQLYSESLSPKNLMPTKYTFIVQASKTIKQAWTLNLSTIYGTGVHLWILMPSVSYNIKNNWDIDATLQSYFAQQYHYKNLGNVVNLRVRYSF